MEESIQGGKEMDCSTQRDDPKKIEEVLKTGSLDDLKICQMFLLKRYNDTLLKNVNLKELRDQYLGRIIKKIYEQDGDQNLIFVSNYISNNCEPFEDVVSCERILYSFLPTPWNKLHPPGVSVDTHTLIGWMKELSGPLERAENYMEWRIDFMNKIGAINCPVSFKLEALCKALGAPFSAFATSLLTAHGYTFFSYYQITKRLDALCWNPKSIIFETLKHTYNNAYKLGSLPDYIKFACDLHRVMDVMEVSELNNDVMMSDVLKYCYNIMASNCHREFSAYCIRLGLKADVHVVLKWVESRIQEMSDTSIDKFTASLKEF